MSGSGGGGGNGPEIELNCETVDFTANLTSIQADVLEEVQVGDELKVDVDHGRVVVRLPDSGNLLGSINWASNSRLVSCMEGGFQYVAKVREIDDGLVKVRVTAA